MDTLTADFAQLRTSKSATLQMKKLPSANGDSLLCVVKTFAGVEKESELYLFNQDWQEQDASRIFDGKSLQELASGLVAKPDTMSESKFVRNLLGAFFIIGVLLKMSAVASFALVSDRNLCRWYLRHECF